MLGQKDIVLLNVLVSDYSVLLKQKRKDPNADLPVIMCPSPDCLLFARKGVSDIYIFNTVSKKFKVLTSRENFTISALCVDKNHAYVLDKNLPDQIRVMDGAFKELRTIPIGFGYSKECEIDMCLIKSTHEQLPENNHVIILSASIPYGSLRALSSAKGTHWVLDCRSHPDLLGTLFNPCSISASDTGDIFIADRGTNRIYTVDKDGKGLHVLLDKDRRIFNPTKVRVDTKGKRLVIINKDGFEIQNYNIITFGSEEKMIPESLAARKSLNTSFHPVLPSAEEEKTMDTSLLELSKRFVEELDLRDVAIRGLGIEGNIVEKHIKDNPNSITSAAYKCFREWLSMQTNVAIARKHMNAALDRTGKALFKQSFNEAFG